MREFNQANNLALLQRKNAGDLLGAIHRVSHFCYFKTPLQAQSAEATFRRAGFDTVLISSSLRSQVQVMHFSNLEIAELNQACDDINTVVEYYDGQYAGWDSPLVTMVAANQLADA